MKIAFCAAGSPVFINHGQPGVVELLEELVPVDLLEPGIVGVWGTGKFEPNHADIVAAGALDACGPAAAVFRPALNLVLIGGRFRKMRSGMHFSGFRSHGAPTCWLRAPRGGAGLADACALALFGLQRGTAADEVAGNRYLRITQTETDGGTVAETAATIMSLDLVISVDTMVAHLAGAHGKPVWLLLPFCADWRWMRERDDSPWYPTMHLSSGPPWRVGFGHRIDHLCLAAPPALLDVAVLVPDRE